MIISLQNLLISNQRCQAGKFGQLEILAFQDTKLKNVEFLTSQITYMFNCSLAACSFPDDWKRATVVPLQKSGDKSNRSNLRPVSLLPLPGKLLETLVHKKITFLDENKLLNEGQIGFRKDRSTIGTVAEVTDDVLLGINNINNTLAAFIDLRKAFDTVSHDILGKKLHTFGFHKNSISWLKGWSQWEEIILAVYSP